MPNNKDFNRFEYSGVDMDIHRSVFNMPFNHKFSFKIGEVIPFFWQFCVPSDTFEVKTSKVVRTSPFVAPVMDDIYIDTYYFFVPMRLVMSKYKEFFGENTSGPWVQDTTPNLPQIEIPHAKVYDAPEGVANSGYGFAPDTIGDYLGVPAFKYAKEYDPDSIMYSKLRINALPFKVYASICNEWFRDENLMTPIQINTTQTLIYGSNGNDQVTDIQKGGHPFIAAKFHDYFTSALPQPQKGPDVEFMSGYVPVYPVERGFGKNQLPWFAKYNVSANEQKEFIEDMPPGYAPSQRKVIDRFINYGYDRLEWIYGPPSVDHKGHGDYKANGSTNGRAIGLVPSTGYSIMSDTTMGQQPDVPIPLNLGADLGVASGNTITALRIAFAMQRYFERLARGGSRYTEYVSSFFNTHTSDARLQRPEYLGGNRVPLNIAQVVQTSESQQTPQGTVTGMSHTSDENDDFIYSVTEHGYIMGVCVARYKHTYAQGLEKHFLAHDVYDLYNPVFANLSEMPIYQYELFFGEVDNASYDATRVFGYQEAWADYRYKPNRVSGLMRPDVANSLSFWNFSDYYETVPSLSAEWIREDPANVDRALAVTSEVTDPLFADFLVDVKAVRPMPLYSIPGLVDHN